MVVSFDTGPTWANWAAQFAAFKKRYPDVEIVYNDLGSAATVVALEKARNRPQADTAYYFAASGVDAAKKGVVAPFKPVNFDKLPAVFREPDGRWFTIHSLTIAFVVNTKLVKNVPQSWADLLKPEYKNSIVYLDPRSTGVGQVLAFAANFANGGDMNNVQPGLDYLGKLHQSGNVLRVLGTTPYAQFVKGEIPIWISLRERRPQGEAHRRARRRGRGRDSEGSLGRGALRHQPGGEGAEPERRQALAQLHHDRVRAGHLRAGLRAAVGAGREAPRRRRRQAAARAAGASARRAGGGGEEGRDRQGLGCRDRARGSAARMDRRWFALLAAPAAIWFALFFALPVAGVAVDAFAGGGTAFAARRRAADVLAVARRQPRCLPWSPRRVSTLVGIAVGAASLAHARAPAHDRSRS